MKSNRRPSGSGIRKRNGRKRSRTGCVPSVLLSVILTATLLTGIPAKDMSEVQAEATALQNPRTDSEGVVTWDCVWFGSYPQAEVITSAMSENYTSVNSAYRRDGDVVVSDSVYTALQNATGWDANNDIAIDGVKYRRMKQGDATFSWENPNCFYLWSDDMTYHYFQYQPIKWLVLNMNGNDAVLMSDIGLDSKRYNETLTSVKWETSTIRSWLNGYGSSNNAYGTDYGLSNFIDSAFSSAEQGAIWTTAVKNENRSVYGLVDGNDTMDKIFLLSESEVYGTDMAKGYGFAYNCATRDWAGGLQMQSSTYAKAMGVSSDTSFTGCAGICNWWLRSPGDSKDALYISCYGDDGGIFVTFVDDPYVGVRPALHLNLSSSNVWSYAGTVSSDGGSTAGEEPPVGDGETTEEPTTEAETRDIVPSVTLTDDTEEMYVEEHLNFVNGDVYKDRMNSA